MLKVLIADDEIKVIKLIEYLVDWSAYDMEIISRVNDGQKALDLIIEKRPDVVISDIRMPNIDGIDLVSRTHEAGVYPYFIIISGYSEFSYAQRGIQLGVEDYLLKPLKKKELESVLSKICEKHSSKTRVEQEKLSLMNRLCKSRSKAKTSLLTDLIVSQDPSVLRFTPEQLREEYGCSFQTTDCAVVIVGHVFTGAPEQITANEEQYSFLLPKLTKDLEELLKPFVSDVFSIVYQNEVVSFAICPEKDAPRIPEELKKLKSYLMGYRSLFPGLQIALGLGAQVHDLSGVPGSYLSAVRALRLRFQHEEQFLYTASADASLRPSLYSVFPASLQKEGLSFIELLDAEGYRAHIRKIRQVLSDHPEGKGLTLEAYDSVCDTFLFGMRSYSDSMLERGIDKAYLLRGPEYLYSYNALWDWLAQICSDLLLYCAAEKQSMEDRPIRQAKQFIREHYNEGISLETVSAQVGFNPAYFSTIFKKATGQNFMDYVKEVRITNAKEMLLQSNQDIAQIAAAVGYSDIKYFSRLFRKLTRVTPSEYRKLYG